MYTGLTTRHNSGQWWENARVLGIGWSMFVLNLVSSYSSCQLRLLLLLLLAKSIMSPRPTPLWQIGVCQKWPFPWPRFIARKLFLCNIFSVPKLHQLSWWFCPVHSQGDDVMMVGVSLTWSQPKPEYATAPHTHLSWDSTFGGIQFVKLFLLSSSSLTKYFIAITHIGLACTLTQMITLCVQVVDGSLSIYAFLCSLTSCS